MSQSMVQHISSSDNAFFKELRKLSKDSTAYRQHGRFWVEGDHLCRAALVRGTRPNVGVFAESVWSSVMVEWQKVALKNLVLPDRLFHDISTLKSPAKMGFVFDLPLGVDLQPGISSVILDRVQDAGNVGSILRSASAFGFKQIIALKGTAALWSPKVVRAAMGAHWGLQLVEGLDVSELATLVLPIVVTSSHRGASLHQSLQNNELPTPCAWALGHEGQGVSAELEALAALHVRIAQPGGEESLNVAAAAAICLHASATASFPAGTLPA